jgi:hypothetical protein
MSTITNTATTDKLTAMFTENTGRSFLDSGGESGRAWQRNQGMTTADYLSAPTATWERAGGATINTYQYLLARLEFSTAALVLNRLIRVWELGDYENRNLFDLEDQEDALRAIGATLGGSVWNTYNYESDLSTVLQGWDFTLNGQTYTLLQVHGGADVRGGYTLPVIFETHCDGWIYQCADYSLWCGGCEFSWSIYGSDITAYGNSKDFELPNGHAYEIFGDGCPKCHLDLIADAESECY